ncbi:MAG: glycosyltransferase [Chloroflexi bacterium]|nr:MAG: glycosyltransferase [Chloroflexota bacterium]
MNESMFEMNQSNAEPTSVLVSIIISTYNRANTISKPIDSVLAQTYPHFELIIIDDGSTDNTDEVVAAYHDPRIIYKWVKNGERSRARNIGISMSQGKYIAFMDSDDWFMPHKLSFQVNAMEANPEVGLALGGWIVVDENGRKILSSHPWQWIQSQPNLEQWLFSATATLHSVLVRKTWFDKVTGFDPELNMAEDIELWMRLSLAGCQTMWTEDYVAAYVVHDSNSLRDWSNVKRGRMKFLNTIFQNPQICEGLTVSKDEVYARFHLDLAWMAFAENLVPQGQQELAQAVELHPKYVAQNADEIRQSIIDYSQHYMVSAPIQFVESVFDNLPPKLAFLQQYRRQTLGIALLSQAWRGREQGEYGRVRQTITRAIWYTPNCLQNRGVWSLLFQAFVGRPFRWALQKG